MPNTNNYDYDIKLLVLNNDELQKKRLISQVTGKDKILQGFNKNDFVIQQKDNKNYRLSLWALGKDEQNNYRAASVALICVNLIDANAIAEAEKHYRDMEINGQEGATIIFVGINAGLANMQVITPENVKQLSEEYNVPYIEISANGANVNQLIDTVVTSYRKKHNLEPVEEKVEVKENPRSFFGRSSQKQAAPEVVPVPVFPEEGLQDAIKEAVSAVELGGRLGQKGAINKGADGSAWVKITAPIGQGGPLIKALKATEFYQQRIKGRYAVSFNVSTASKVAAFTIHRGFESTTVTFTPKALENQATFSSSNNNNNNNNNNC